jgi:hypothetical protein
MLSPLRTLSRAVLSDGLQDRGSKLQEFPERGACLLAAMAIVALQCSCGWVSDASEVVGREISPQVLLAKYEWFKDASAQLDQKIATAKTYESRFASIKSGYPKDAMRSTWAREDREQFSIWQSELSGIKASYNELAAKYNAEMAKVNWRFANVGELPQGAANPLPREYKPYLTE